MAKPKSAYVCSECGAHSVKWAGQCPDCASWNTLTRTAIAPSRAAPEAAVAPATIESLPDDLAHRDSTGFDEFDRVLGGGLVPGAVVLLGGDPGVGKSTLLQQVCANLAAGLQVFYATGE
ncbi:MAG: AAA family ATPase, partial [Woeseiaceae bacterium]